MENYPLTWLEIKQKSKADAEKNSNGFFEI
jgi:hypothetical protein